MNTNSAAALGTTPFHFFILNEFPYAQFFDVLKVLNHAHIVFGSIPFVQMTQMVAGDFITFKTKPCISLLKNFAIFDFTSYTGSSFIGICPHATGTFIFFS